MVNIDHQVRLASFAWLAEQVRIHGDVLLWEPLAKGFEFEGRRKEQCAFCRLRHRHLLEAAHIIPDGEPQGEPIISNGISLCKLHHAAFDKYFLGLRPDYVIEVRRDILEEDDDPMLLHGLQGLHMMKMYVPRPAEARPTPDFLDWRYKRFEKADRSRLCWRTHLAAVRGPGGGGVQE